MLLKISILYVLQIYKREQIVLLVNLFRVLIIIIIIMIIIIIIIFMDLLKLLHENIYFEVCTCNHSIL